MFWESVPHAVNETINVVVPYVLHSFITLLFLANNYYSLRTHKVEGAKTNTPPNSNTYTHLPITNTLLL